MVKASQPMVAVDMGNALVSKMAVEMPKAFEPKIQA
jgi:hypothetical protein